MKHKRFHKLIVWLLSILILMIIVIFSAIPIGAWWYIYGKAELENTTKISTSEPPVEITEESINRITKESAVEVTKESTTESIVEPIIESSIELAIESTVELTTEIKTEIVTEAASEFSTEPTTIFIPEYITEQTIEFITEPTIKPPDEEIFENEMPLDIVQIIEENIGLEDDFSNPSTNDSFLFVLFVMIVICGGAFIVIRNKLYKI